MKKAIFAISATILCVIIATSLFAGTKDRPRVLLAIDGEVVHMNSLFFKEITQTMKKDIFVAKALHPISQKAFKTTFLTSIFLCAFIILSVANPVCVPSDVLSPLESFAFYSTLTFAVAFCVTIYHYPETEGAILACILAGSFIFVMHSLLSLLHLMNAMYSSPMPSSVSTITNVCMWLSLASWKGLSAVSFNVVACFSVHFALEVLLRLAALTGVSWMCALLVGPVVMCKGVINRELKWLQIMLYYSLLVRVLLECMAVFAGDQN